MIYQTFVNDLDDYCNLTMDYNSVLDLYDNYTKYDKYFAKFSFLTNYIYFLFDNNKIIDNYFGFFNRCLDDDETAKNYFSHLDQFLKEAHDLDYSKVIVVLIPVLLDNRYDEKFESDLKYFFSRRLDCDFISVSDIVSDLKVKDRIISSQDIHASKEVNRRIANVIISMLKE